MAEQLSNIEASNSSSDFVWVFARGKLISGNEREYREFLKKRYAQKARYLYDDKQNPVNEFK